FAFCGIVFARMLVWRERRSGRAAPRAGKMHQQQRNRGRRDPADALRLADRRGPRAAEFREDLRGQAAHVLVCEVRWNVGGLMATLALDLVPLALEIARVARVRLD